MKDLWWDTVSALRAASSKDSLYIFSSLFPTVHSPEIHYIDSIKISQGLIIYKICFQKEFLRLKRLPGLLGEKKKKKFSRLFLIKPTCSDEDDASRCFSSRPSSTKRKLRVTYCTSFLPSLVKPASLPTMDRCYFLRPISGDLQRDSDAVGYRPAWQHQTGHR